MACALAPSVEVKRRRQRLRPAARRVAHEALAVERQLDLAQGERDPADDLRQAVGGDVEPRVAGPGDDPREARPSCRGRTGRPCPGTVIARPASEPSIGAVRKTSPLICSGAEPGPATSVAEPTRLLAGHCAARALSRSHRPMPLPSPPTRPGGNEIAMSLMRCGAVLARDRAHRRRRGAGRRGIDAGAEPRRERQRVGTGGARAVPVDVELARRARGAACRCRASARRC